MKLSEACEQLWDVLSQNSFACVSHLNFKIARLMTVTCKNVNVAILSVLECVLNQVDQNLLEASTVTFQDR